jgi:hypothetical protein
MRGENVGDRPQGSFESQNRVGGVTQGGFEAERTGFFPSLQATLNHIYVIDLFYVDALEGGTFVPQLSRPVLPSWRAYQSIGGHATDALGHSRRPDATQGFAACPLCLRLRPN